MPELTFAPTVTYVQAGGQSHGQAQGAGGKPPEGSWTPSTQAAVTRLLSLISNTQTRLHAAMGGNMTEGQKQYMAQYQHIDLASLAELQAKYNHVLSHHGFKGKEVTTTMGDLKKAMKTDISDITISDARANTLKGLEKKEWASARK